MGRTVSAPRVPAQWTDDCSGKKDFDGEIVAISTRYWPQGGGFYIHDGSNFYQNTEGSPPSAHSRILLQVGGDDDEPVELVEQDFTGDSFESVRVQVETWAAVQYGRVAAALKREFA